MSEEVTVEETEDETAEEEKIQAVIATQSKMLGSRPARLYIRENTIELGKHKIDKSELADIQMIEDDRTDYRSIGVILLNMLIGVVLAYTITTYIPWFLLIVGLSTFTGYAVVRVARETPYGYVSLETKNSEFRFGISDPISAAQLFGAVYQELDKDLTHEAFTNTAEPAPIIEE